MLDASLGGLSLPNADGKGCLLFNIGQKENSLSNTNREGWSLLNTS